MPTQRLMAGMYVTTVLLMLLLFCFCAPAPARTLDLIFMVFSPVWFVRLARGFAGTMPAILGARVAQGGARAGFSKRDL